MRRMYTLGFALLMLLLVPAAAAWGQLNSYYFAQSTGDPTSMTGSTTIFQGGPGVSQGTDADDFVYTVPIGFNFRFNSVTYPTLWVSTNGIIFFTSTTNSAPNNSIAGAPVYPFLAPFWENLRVSGGSFCTNPRMHYVVRGSAPNRVLTIEYSQIQLTPYFFGQNPATFQVRLFETSNKIEYWYGDLNPCDVCLLSNSCNSTSASVGIAAASNQFISVTFPGGTPTESRTVANNSININGNPIKPNTLVVFGECVAVLNGRIGPDNGGTATVNNGDTFFSGLTTQVGQSAVYRPFDIRMVSSVCSAPYTLTITGPAAADYYFDTPGTQTVTRTLALGGEVHIPEITFKPTGSGTRSATLTVTALGLTRTFNLGAYAPFVNYVGIIPEGGTTKMASGDVLLVGKRIDRHTSANYTPFTLINVSNVSVPISYSISGGFGQYTISPGGPLGPGLSTTPVITFNALGFGVVNAQLQVTAGTEVRTFTLAATSAAPGGEFRLGSALLDTGSTLFTNSYVCVGSQVQALKVEMVNTGYGDFKINGAQFFEIDTVIRQGIPKYAFRRDEHGYLIPSQDYVVSLDPNGAVGGNVFPITLIQGQSQTIYITFKGTTTGKRYARGFIYTNSQNTAAADTLGVVQEGIVAFDVFGRGSGARLADASGNLPKSVLFEGAKLGSSSQATLHLTNPGVCDLRISMPKLQITAGDVDEFSIVSLPTGTIDPVTKDLILAPGQSTDMVLQFTPLQAGSRRAGLRLATNDSGVIVPGITERGVYYIDLFGSGGTDMYAQGVTFGQSLINGTAQDHLHGTVRVINTMSVDVSVDTIVIDGVDKDDFEKGQPWPGTPYILRPGEELELGVIFAPKALPTGDRLANVRLVGSTPFVANLEGNAALKGFAGTRTIEVMPGAINFPSTTFGKFQRRMVRVTNTGTMPLHLEQPHVDGPDAPNFQLSPLTDRLEPGISTQFELTYAPIGPTLTISAPLVVESNATTGSVTVMLSGSSPVLAGPEDGSRPVTGVEDGTGRGDNLNVSGVDAATSVSGMTLYQSRPNPAQEIVEIRYSLPAEGSIQLDLYDGQGRMVRKLDDGNRLAGMHDVRTNISELPAGLYHYRLTMNGITLTRTLLIVR